MSTTIKGGKEIITDFIESLSKRTDLDSKTVKAFSDLYRQGKLTDKNLQNALDGIVAEEIKNIKITDGED